MAAGGLEGKRRVISKHFRRLLDNYERQTFTGARLHLIPTTLQGLFGSLGRQV